MKKYCTILFLLPALAGLISCSSAKNITAKDLDGAWNIVSVKGEGITKEELPFLVINVSEKKVHGNTGCNIINSSITFDESDASAVKFSMPMSTLMACPYLELENKISQALIEVGGVKGGEKKGELSLVDKDGNGLLLLDKKEDGK
ncbi:META domain-containing protein [Parabacteroides sp. Marseille-P3160]|uniref:META domain-containing protein n=1 Tax=Parabacteroides sp. Marseille-P3160 TaxID=1917887 RepID=UPI0009B98D9A|nr:META domain-containing protein [Parabacteroides sp. Marseille-P3160]